MPQPPDGAVAAAAGGGTVPAPRTLQARLLLPLVGLMAGVWVLIAVATWSDTRHELDELLDSHLAQAAALLVVQQSREPDGDEDDGDHQVDAPSLHRYAPKVAFQVFHNGSLVLRSASATTEPMFGDLDGFRGGFRTVSRDGVEWRVFAAEGREQDIQVYVGEQSASRAAILWAVLRSTLWPMVLALPLLGLAAWWAVRRGLLPLRELGRELGRRAPDALQPLTVATDAPAEMMPMVDALNGLLARIAALMESERRFTADAAHELRTPIAAIRAQAQAALGETDDAARRHALEWTMEGCDRAARLVEQLLTLARLEASADGPLADVDLAQLLREVAGELAPAAVPGQELEVDAASGARLRGDPALLAVLLRNLLDNAIRYSPAGATVKATMHPQAGQLLLTVEDSGPGMRDADRQRLGERFFRVAGSGQDGSGLGWSIVRRIAAVHGARVRAERSASLGGLAVEVAFAAAG